MSENQLLSEIIESEVLSVHKDRGLTTCYSITIPNRKKHTHSHSFDTIAIVWVNKTQEYILQLQRSNSNEASTSYNKYSRFKSKDLSEVVATLVSDLKLAVSDPQEFHATIDSNLHEYLGIICNLTPFDLSKLEIVDEFTENTEICIEKHATFNEHHIETEYLKRTYHTTEPSSSNHITTHAVDLAVFASNKKCTHAYIYGESLSLLNLIYELETRGITPILITPVGSKLQLAQSSLSITYVPDKYIASSLPEWLTQRKD